MTLPFHFKFGRLSFYFYLNLFPLVTGAYSFSLVRRSKFSLLLLIFLLLTFLLLHLFIFQTWCNRFIERLQKFQRSPVSLRCFSFYSWGQYILQLGSYLDLSWHLEMPLECLCLDTCNTGYGHVCERPVVAGVRRFFHYVSGVEHICNICVQILTLRLYINWKSKSMSCHWVTFNDRHLEVIMPVWSVLSRREQDFLGARPPFWIFL